MCSVINKMLIRSTGVLTAASAWSGPELIIKLIETEAVKKNERISASSEERKAARIMYAQDAENHCRQVHDM